MTAIFDLHFFSGVRQNAQGLLEDVPWTVDQNFPAAMRDQLFNQRRDIVAMNLNRGRDHGLDSYVNYRQAYGLSVPSSWDDMLQTHPSVVVEQLKNVYDDVGDIELFIGGETDGNVDGQ